MSQQGPPSTVLFKFSKTWIFLYLCICMSAWGKANVFCAHTGSNLSRQGWALSLCTSAPDPAKTVILGRCVLLYSHSCIKGYSLEDWRCAKRCEEASVIFKMCRNRYMLCLNLSVKGMLMWWKNMRQKSIEKLCSDYIWRMWERHKYRHGWREKGLQSKNNLSVGSDI